MADLILLAWYGRHARPRDPLVPLTRALLIVTIMLLIVALGQWLHPFQPNGPGQGSSPRPTNSQVHPAPAPTFGGVLYPFIAP